MGDTLRSIIEKWRAGAQSQSFPTPSHVFRSCAAELEALLAEYEKVDLVKKWKQVANDMREGATRERAYAERFYDERAEHLRNATDFGETANLYDAHANELETWLAVNALEAQAKGEAMTDIEQKAREVAEWFARKYMTPKRSPTYCIADMAKEVADTIRDAVDEERLENRKLFSIGMSDLRRESNYDRICDKVHQIDESIRARAQAKEKP